MCASYSILYEESEGRVSQCPTFETFIGPHPKEHTIDTIVIPSLYLSCIDNIEKINFYLCFIIISNKMILYYINAIARTYMYAVVQQPEWDGACALVKGSKD